MPEPARKLDEVPSLAGTLPVSPQPDAAEADAARSGSFVLSTLAEYRPSRATFPDQLGVLTRVVAELTQYLEGVDDRRRWFTAAFSATLVAPDGTAYRGFNLLKELAEARARSDLPTGTAFLPEMLNRPEYTPPEAFRRTVRETRGIEIPPSNAARAGEALDLAPTLFSGTNPAALTADHWERIFRAILDEQFGGDFMSMTLSAVERAQYQFGLNARFTGATLLRHWAEALFRADGASGTAAAGGRAEATKVSEYTPAKCLELFRKRAIGEALKAPVALVVAVPSLSPEVLRPPPVLAAIERILREVAEHAPDPLRVLTMKRLPFAVCRGPDGTQVPLLGVLRLYSVARFRAASPDSATTELEILTQRGYRIADSLAHFLKESGLAKTVAGAETARTKERQIRDFVSKHPLGAILETLCRASHDPTMIIEGLKLLQPRAASESPVPLIELVPRYVGLETGTRAPATRDGGGPPDFFNPLIEGILIAAEAKEALDFNEAGFQELKGLTIRGYWLKFQEHPDGLVAHLRDREGEFDKAEQPVLAGAHRELMGRLLREVREHYEGALTRGFEQMTTEPAPHQRLAVNFLAPRNRALLAFGPGSGKTYALLAAALAQGDDKRIIYLCPTSTVNNVRREALTHTKLGESDVAVITSDSPDKRARQIAEAKDARVVVIGYETLGVLKEDYPHLYALVQEDIDIAIHDEAHIPENEKTQRGEAVRGIKAAIKWFSSATPWRTGVEGFWWIANQLNPVLFPTQAHFNHTYCQSTDGLDRLRRDLLPYMLQGAIEDLILPFEDPEIVPFEVQLADNQVRVPTQRILSDLGSFTLSPMQEHTILWMVTDFPSWAADFNERYAGFDNQIDLDNINPLVKFDWIHRAIYHPEELGLGPNTAMLEALDQAVAARLAVGDKVIEWVREYRMSDELALRHRHFGVRQADGRDALDPRTERIDDFQESPTTRVLVATEEAIGIGQTLTAAGTAVIVEPPLTFARWFQELGRHQRTIGMDKIRFAKQYANVVVMRPQYSKKFLASIEDQRLRAIFERGTLPEQTLRRIEGGKFQYKCVTAGYTSEDDFDKQFRRELSISLGLAERDARGKRDDLRPQARALADAAERFRPVWEKVRSDEDAQAALVRLISQARFPAHTEHVKAIADVLAGAEKVSATVCDFVTAILEIKNRTIREQLLALTPTLVTRPDEVDELLEGVASLEDQDGTVHLVKLFPLLARLTAENGARCVPQELVDELAALGDSPESRAVRQDFLFGTLGVLNSPSARAFVLELRPLLDGSSPRAVVKLMYQLGHLSRLPGVTIVAPKPPPTTFGALAEHVEGRVHVALEDFARVDRGAIGVMLRDPLWQNSVDHLVAFLAGWEEMGDRRVVEQARELYHAIFSGTFYEWRYHQRKQAGNDLAYKANQQAFWEEFAKNTRIPVLEMELTTRQTRARLEDEYAALRRQSAALTDSPEGTQTKAFLSRVVRFRNGHSGDYRAELGGDSAILGRAIASLSSDGVMPTEVDPGFTKKYGIELGGSVANALAELRRVRFAVDSCLSWMALEEEFQHLEAHGQFKDPTALKGILTRKAKLYARERKEQLSVGWEALRQHVDELDEPKRDKLRVSVEETDHPAILTRMGCLSPRLTNCYNPNADPFFTSWVIGACGTPSFKLVVTTDLATREYLSPQPLKVRTTVGASRSVVTNFLLEKGPYSGGYDFRQEALDLLQAKADAMSRKIGEPFHVSHQVLGRARRTDVLVEGIGAYTDNEYVEPVFGLRNALRVSHIARLYDPLDFAQHRDQPQILGLGFGRKSVAQYIRELRDMGAAVVVDVRGDPEERRPRIQGWEAFTGTALRTALNDVGIEYLWLGDYLAPRGAQAGPRAVGAYREFMSTERYSRGREFIEMKLASASGPVILTTAELRDTKCFRRLIIQDVVARLGERVPA